MTESHHHTSTNTCFVQDHFFRSLRLYLTRCLYILMSTLECWPNHVWKTIEPLLTNTPQWRRTLRRHYTFFSIQDLFTNGSTLTSVAHRSQWMNGSQTFCRTTIRGYAARWYDSMHKLRQCLFTLFLSHLLTRTYFRITVVRVVKYSLKLDMIMQTIGIIKNIWNIFKRLLHVSCNAAMPCKTCLMVVISTFITYATQLNHKMNVCMRVCLCLCVCVCVCVWEGRDQGAILYSL